MEKKKKKAPMLLIFAVTLAVGSLVFILNEGGGIFRLLLGIAKLFYVALMNIPGEDLTAFFLVVTVFSVGAIATIAYFIPRIKLRDERQTKITVWVLQIAQIVLVAPPIVAGAVVSIKLSLWFIVPVLILAIIGSLYLVSRVWLPKLKGRE
ncbi:MAG: hypothetical protein GY771_15495 [bacterium]|nr:hypothetical protein [bacterium]